MLIYQTIGVCFAFGLLVVPCVVFLERLISSHFQVEQAHPINRDFFGGTVSYLEGLWYGLIRFT